MDRKAWQVAGQLAELVFWFGLWAAIPAVLLYPLAKWAMIHTQVSPNMVVQGYGVGVALLFLPTGFLVDFLYRRFILNRHRRD